MNASAVIAALTDHFGTGKAVRALTDRIPGDPDIMSAGELATVARQLPATSRVRSFVLAHTAVA